MLCARLFTGVTKLWPLPLASFFSTHSLNFHHALSGGRVSRALSFLT